MVYYTCTPLFSFSIESSDVYALFVMHFGRVENDVRVAEVIDSLRSGYRQVGGDYFVILFPFVVQPNGYVSF